MYLYLYRTESIGNAQMGQLVQRDKTISDTLENTDFLIPEGVYKVQMTMSPRFGEVLPLLCFVPGRSGIRIHPGNTAEHSKGCILVGKADGGRLLESRRMFNTLREQWLGAVRSGEEILLEVRKKPDEHLNAVYDRHTQMGCFLPDIGFSILKN